MKKLETLYEEMEKNYQHLTSIVGIGLINGAALIAYTGNF